MAMQKPSEILAAAGVSEREAWATVSVFWRETEARLERLIRLQKLDKLRFMHSHVRCIPWPHVGEYNALLERMVCAPTTAELKPEMLAAKEQVARRLNRNAARVFCGIGRNAPQIASTLPTLSHTERADARTRIIELLQVGADGEPRGSFEREHWFSLWSCAVMLALLERPAMPIGN
jgi:hypothetical protein